MARVRFLDRDELDSGLQKVIDANPGDRNELVRVFGHTPEPYRAFMRFYNNVMENGQLEVKLKELVRLKIAAINECSF